MKVSARAGISRADNVSTEARAICNIQKGYSIITMQVNGYLNYLNTLRHLCHLIKRKKYFLEHPALRRPFSFQTPPLAHIHAKD